MIDPRLGLITNQALSCVFCNLFRPDHRQGYAERAALVAIVRERAKAAVTHDRLRVSLALLCEVTRINERGAGSVAGLSHLAMTALHAIE